VGWSCKHRGGRSLIAARLIADIERSLSLRDDGTWAVIDINGRGTTLPAA
jgi:hypothetical protein